MKFKLSIIALIIFSTFFSVAAKSVEKDIHDLTVKILDLSKSNKFKEASTLFAYKGIDKKRVNNDHFNYSNKDEKLKVKRICRKIKSLEMISKSYEVGKVQTIKNKKSTNYVVKIKYKSSTQTIVINFVFIKINGKYLLSDID